MLSTWSEAVVGLAEWVAFGVTVRLARCHLEDARRPDVSPREPRLLIAGDPLPMRLSRSRAKGAVR